MGWSIGFDPRWQRDIGYGVPATCDHPGCGAEIDRGLSYVCGGEPYGGDHGCGLYFCDAHLAFTTPKIVGPRVEDDDEADDEEELASFPGCARCAAGEPPFDPTPDTPEWINHKATDDSWAEWRATHPSCSLPGAGDGGGR